MPLVTTTAKSLHRLESIKASTHLGVLGLADMMSRFLQPAVLVLNEIILILRQTAHFGSTGNRLEVLQEIALVLH